MPDLPPKLRQYGQEIALTFPALASRQFASTV
jgi:hypothetical protein